jgi:hypothetical protein
VVRCHGVGRANADHLGNDAAHLGRRVELAFALAAFAGEVAHQVLVCIAQNVVVLGAVLREVEHRVLEDANQVAQALHHRRPFAQLVRGR